jgi:hypothetical protein
MNITQRKYTLERLVDLHKQKTLAILAENDLLVEAHNKTFKVTFNEAEQLLKKHPELLIKKQNTTNMCELEFSFDVRQARKLLNKPDYTLTPLTARSYLSDSENKHKQQTICKTIYSDRVVLNNIADRINKLNARIVYAKDQVMLGDAQKALDALEEINSLLF